MVKTSLTPQRDNKVAIQVESAHVYAFGETASFVRLQCPLPVTVNFRPTVSLRSSRVTFAPCRAACRAAINPDAPAPTTAIFMLALYKIQPEERFILRHRSGFLLQASHSTFHTCTSGLASSPNCSSTYRRPLARSKATSPIR